jgi:hypothetical protein
MKWNLFLLQLAVKWSIDSKCFGMNNLQSADMLIAILHIGM